MTTAGWVEQFGRVVVEGQASGVPVVASDSGALPDVVGGDGLLVPPGDPAALATPSSASSTSRACGPGCATAGLGTVGRFSWASVAEVQQRPLRAAVAGVDRTRRRAGCDGGHGGDGRATRGGRGARAVSTAPAAGPAGRGRGSPESGRSSASRRAHGRRRLDVTRGEEERRRRPPSRPGRRCRPPPRPGRGTWPRPPPGRTPPPGAGASRIDDDASSPSVSLTCPRNVTDAAQPSSSRGARARAGARPSPATTSCQPRSPRPLAGPRPEATSGAFSASSRCSITTRRRLECRLRAIRPPRSGSPSSAPCAAGHELTDGDLGHDRTRTVTLASARLTAEEPRTAAKWRVATTGARSTRWAR